MELYSQGKNYKIYHSDMRNMLEDIAENSIDCIVCDPPYGLTSIVKRFGKENSAEAKYGKDGSFQRLSRGFMGKEWDGSGVEYDLKTWESCLRVLKAGGYLLAFGGSRTYHRIACAIEDAGFEIRDTIMWLYGSGFPKSMSISKGIEARETYGNAGTRNKRKIEQSCDTEEYVLKQTNNGAMGDMIETTRKTYIPSSDNAKKWDGWGTCLKPSYEPIIVARKPFKGSLIDNVLEYGVGGLNIDECRVGNETISIHNAPAGTFAGGEYDRGSDTESYRDSVGRFPANTILTYDDSDFDEVCSGFPNTKSNGGVKTMPKMYAKSDGVNIYNFGHQNAERIESDYVTPSDSGSAARYFYCAKASKKDRDEGLDEFEEKQTTDGCIRANSETARKFGANSAKRKNTHPTVKPTELMQYLIRLVAPAGATILDPFMGSGTTGIAAKELNRNFIGIEINKDYFELAKKGY